MRLSEVQRGVLRGMLQALGISLLAVGAVIMWPPQAVLPALGDELGHALAWDILVMACVAGNIAWVARHRFFTPEDIEGSGLAAGTDRVRRYQALLQNTLEQAVLAVGTHGVWAASMPAHWQGAVPVAVLLFLLGRVLFWRGYAAGAGHRALGFALTFYPSVLLLLLVVGRRGLQGLGLA
ncbi:MAPEG family protein [Pseudomonas mangiferae]|uniref:MAPEG family protein n=1 Tax=Pseudomonas mangiferae TaxID=2593654 RepID=A0A553H1D6_9PSED|nr:MAPEG family protein [Pseudomonas mangiferae]TRX75574.1 MAPEG family protein [Pseudomonas mangiferae]